MQNNQNFVVHFMLGGEQIFASTNIWIVWCRICLRAFFTSSTYTEAKKKQIQDTTTQQQYSSIRINEKMKEKIILCFLTLLVAFCRLLLQWCCWCWWWCWCWYCYYCCVWCYWFLVLIDFVVYKVFGKFGIVWLVELLSWLQITTSRIVFTPLSSPMRQQVISVHLLWFVNNILYSHSSLPEKVKLTTLIIEFLLQRKKYPKMQQEASTKPY